MPSGYTSFSWLVNGLIDGGNSSLHKKVYARFWDPVNLRVWRVQLIPVKCQDGVGPIRGTCYRRDDRYHGHTHARTRAQGPPAASPLAGHLGSLFPTRGTLRTHRGHHAFHA